MTQKQLMDALIEKIATQAAEIALTKHQRDLWYKHHEAMKERARNAEQERDEARSECETWRSRYDKVVEEFRNPVYSIIQTGSVYDYPLAEKEASDGE